MPHTDSKKSSGLKELQVLEQVEAEPGLSQRTLANRLGIALGMANAILKRLAKKGFVKTKRITPNKLAYLMTPKGLSEKTNLVMRYAGQTVDFYRRTKGVLVEQLEPLRKKGVRRVALCGVGEMGELVYLALRQLDIEVVCAVNNNLAGGKWLGLNVISMDEVPASQAEALVVAEPAGERIPLTVLKKYKIKLVRAGHRE